MHRQTGYPGSHTTAFWAPGLALAVVLVAATGAAGCGGGNGTPGLGDADPEIDGDPLPDGGADDDGGPVLSQCPTNDDGLHGPSMARVRWADGIAFCIDSTEVTNAQYAEFLTAQIQLNTQGPRCGWNTTFNPETLSTNGPTCPPFDPAGRASHPVVCVDWCDADAYCRWAGKHLCQKPGGGVVMNAGMKNASEWVIACTGDGAGDYPYGMSAEAGRCVDKLYPSTTPGLRPVKDAAMCEGGVPGLFDIAGNAWEWHDDCDEKSANGSDDTCHPRGGSFSSETVAAACLSETPFFRKQVAGDTGFRCCVDARFF
jgi:formylglycine-generating enzyme required for sulfatase activity